MTLSDIPLLLFLALKSYETHFSTKFHCDLGSCRGWSHVCTSSREHSVKMETIFKCYCQRSISPSSHNIVIEPYPAPASYACTGFGVSLSGWFLKKVCLLKLHAPWKKKYWCYFVFNVYLIRYQNSSGLHKSLRYCISSKGFHSLIPYFMVIIYLLCGNYWRRESIQGRKFGN